LTDVEVRTPAEVRRVDKRATGGIDLGYIDIGGTTAISGLEGICGRKVNGARPRTTTDEAGAYRFENVCPGRFTVVVEDERAGYPSYVWAAYFLNEETKRKTQEVSLAPGRSEVELPVPVPPKAGVLDLQVHNRRTGSKIRNVQVILKPQHSNGDWITFNSDTEELLVPSNTDLLLRVNADGFREWRDAAKTGKQIRLPPSAHLTVEADLEPQ
jgi:hypothetical protein